MTQREGILSGRLLVVAFEGWNDAGEAASGAVRALKERLDLAPLFSVDPELYFDYQFNRPTVSIRDDGSRRISWPQGTLYGPSRVAQSDAASANDAASSTALEDAVTPVSAQSDNAANIFVLLGTEPSRSWQGFCTEILDSALAADVSSIVFLGAMLADVPHTRPISIFVTSESADVQKKLNIERSDYEGPVGIIGALSEAAGDAGIPTLSIWASVPHYVHNAPSPKATLALIDRLEQTIGVAIPRGDLEGEAAAWEKGIDVLASEDDDMGSYIRQLEQARDTVDSPEASGEAIAQEFERYLRRRDPGAG